APELGKEAVIVSRDTGAGGMIGIDHDAHVLWIEAGRQRSRAHQVADHHREMTALGLVTRQRIGSRRKMRWRGRGSGKASKRPKQSPAISKKHDAKLVLEIIVREVLKDRKIDPLFDKPVRIFGEPEGRKPLCDRRHLAMRPVA